MDYPLSQAGSLDLFNGKFTDGVPGLRPASLIPSGTTNDLIDEILAVQEAGGIVNDEFNRTQLKTAIINMIEARVGDYSMDTGVANAYVIAMNPPVQAYYDGMPFQFRVAHGCTGASTLTAGGAVRPLVRDDGMPVQDGDLPLGAIVSGNYVAATTSFQINSLVLSQTMTQTQADARYLTQAAGDARYLGAVTSKIQSVSASLAANALTLTYNGGRLDFRSPTPTVGVPIQNVVLAANSLVAPLGASLGMTSGQIGRLILLEAYNAGSPVLCVANLAGGMQLDETNLISPTTISAGATSAGIIYSASAVAANSPYRLVGAVDAVFTAGTGWTSITNAQGVGGQALAAMASYGYGQTLQDVTSQRTLGGTFINPTGKTITVHYTSPSQTTQTVTVTVDGSMLCNPNTSATSTAIYVSFPVPPWKPYSINQSTGSIGIWKELR